MPSSRFFLTKSAYAVAVTCPTKLNYLMAGYPTSTEEDEYLKLLAEGGFIVGAMAQFAFPDGALAPRTGDPDTDFEWTRTKILEGDCTLFEPTVVSGSLMAVADILERKGDVLRLIEVKSKSFERAIDPEDGREVSPFRTKKGEIASEWMPYLQDIGFQYNVLAKCFPRFRIEATLLLVDKSKRPAIDGLPKLFSLSPGGGASRPSVRFSGDKTSIAREGDILSALSVNSELESVLPLVEENVRLFTSIIGSGEKLPPKLGKCCKDCEFQGETLSPSGYDECWQSVGKPDPHLFDLFFGGALQASGKYLFDDLLSQGKASLYDVPLTALKGKRGERQLIQIEYTKKNAEWFDSHLGAFMADAKYPLHFIDFETTRTALPFHAGMRPFEQIAFQWSCHTVSGPGAEPLHTEWINVEPGFPNFNFARSLMETLSAEGTVLTWATHEGSVLTDILRQMTTYEYKDAELSAFLGLLVSSKGSQGRLVDMNRLTVDYYFHPRMKGRTSIKYVFPAIWEENEHLRSLPWFKPYERVVDGKPVSPYDDLPAFEVGGKVMAVREGTAAMRAYEEMIFGPLSGLPSEKEKIRRLLLQYCKLDTLAMVAIWEHWRSLAVRSSSVRDHAS